MIYRAYLLKPHIYTEMCFFKTAFGGNHMDKNDKKACRGLKTQVTNY